MLFPYMQADLIALSDVNAQDIVAHVIALADVIANISMFYILMADVIAKGLCWILWQ